MTRGKESHPGRKNDTPEYLPGFIDKMNPEISSTIEETVKKTQIFFSRKAYQLD